MTLSDFHERYPEIEVELIETPFIKLTAGALSGAARKGRDAFLVEREGDGLIRLAECV